MKSYTEFLVFGCCIFSLFSCATCASRKLHEHEIDSAIFSTIMKRNSRLETEKHRQNKSIIAALTMGGGNSLDGVSTSDKPETTDSMEAASPAALIKAKQDAIIRQLWGGSCKFDDWSRCHNVTTWGGDYMVKDAWEHFEMECTTFKSVCMRNGWTVNRCHLLCMSSCNRELLVTNMYDKYVLHEGMCPPISKKVRRETPSAYFGQYT